MKSMMCVKSIMTILVTIMLCILTYVYPDNYSEVFKNVAIMVATFYFSHQTNKRGVEDGVGNRIDLRVDNNTAGGE